MYPAFEISLLCDPPPQKKKIVMIVILRLNPYKQVIVTINSFFCKRTQRFSFQYK